MDMMELRFRMMAMLGGGDVGAWKQKTVTVQSAISNGGGFKSFIQSNVPNDATFVFIVNDNQDNTQYANNQLVFGTYTPYNALTESFCRYRNSSYVYGSQTHGIWSATYDLTAQQGDTYTLFYQ